MELSKKEISIVSTLLTPKNVTPYENVCDAQQQNLIYVTSS